MFAVILLYALFATIFPLGKAALSSSQPFFLSGARLVLAGVIVLGYLFVRHRKINVIWDRQNCVSLLLLAVFNIYLTNGYEFWGLQFLSAPKTSLLYSSSPFFAATIAYFFFKETMSVTKLLGMVLGIFGIGISVVMSADSSTEITFLGYVSYGELALFVSAFATVIGWSVMRSVVRRGTTSFAAANGISLVWGGIMCLMHSAVTETWAPWPIHARTYFVIGTIIACALVIHVICYNWYAYLLNRYSVTLISFAGVTSPFFTAFYSWLFLDTRPSYMFFLSLSIVTIGLYLFYKEELRQGYILSP